MKTKIYLITSVLLLTVAFVYINVDNNEDESLNADKEIYISNLT